MFLLLLTLISFVSSQKFHAAFDIYNSATYNDMKIMQNGNYQMVFISAYTPTATSAFLDPSACSNLKNANQAGVAIEVYMVPNAKSSKTATTQANEVVSGLKACNVNVASIWIWVVSPTHWDTTSTSNNCFFIQGLITAFKANNVSANIYTRKEDWTSITGNYDSTTFGGNKPMLWYYHVFGAGPNYESGPNFGDFESFGGWTKPVIKQYAQNEVFTSSGVNVAPINRDVYVLANGQRKMQQFNVDERITVGGNF